MSECLSQAEVVEREQLEAVIQSAQTHDLLEAQALLEIRRRRLYRDGFRSFGAYCRQRWGFSRPKANRRCKWAEVVENLSPLGDTYPSAEWQARPLFDLTPDEQRTAWRQCVQVANGKITPKLVGGVCERLRQSRDPATTTAVAVRETVESVGAVAKPRRAKRLNSPLAYYGSKHRLAKRLVALMPPHRCYVEVFGGGASLLFAKRPSKVEVYNDVDEEVVNFFDVLRGPLRAKLIEQLELTPHARSEHARCKRSYGCTTDPVERARRFFVLVRQSYSGIFGNAYSTSKVKAVAATFARKVEGLEEVIERLRPVQIEGRDFRRIIPKFDDEETCFYCDPPYVHSTRSSRPAGRRLRQYRHEMTDGDHAELLGLLRSAKGKVMLSGYDSPLYRRMLSGWRRWTKTVQCVSATTNNNPRVRRTEVVWMNF